MLDAADAEHCTNLLIERRKFLAGKYFFYLS